MIREFLSDFYLIIILGIMLLAAIVIFGFTDVKVEHQLDPVTSVSDPRDAEITKLKFFLSEAFRVEYTGQPMYTKKVTATAYTARAVECNSEPWVTASGRPSRVGGIAISRDLEALGLTLGDMVVIKGMGLFRIEDRMNKRWKNRIDILHAHLTAAKNFAKQELEIMWLGKARHS